jgi:predicted O-linked N-acetylglucosamine transferase (SPINDLY family)
MSDFLLRTARRMRESGNLAEAARMYGEVLRIDPRQFEALHALGVLYYGAARFEDAARFLEQAVASDAGSRETWFTHGCALQRLGRMPEALRSYDEALALDPAYVDALVNRAVVLLALKRPQDALAAVDAALAADPSALRAHINRGCALDALARREEALIAFDKVLALEPASVETLVNRGATLFALKRYDEAAADYEKAHGLNPDIPYLFGNLVHYRLHACNWRHYIGDAEAIAKGVRAGKPIVQPFVCVTVSPSPADQLRCAKLAIARDAPLSKTPLWRGEAYGHDRLRIAYLSADYRDHAVARLVAGVLESHDKRHFETVALALLPSDGGVMRARAERAFDRFHDIADMSDLDAAGLLRREEIDIAVDLTGFTAGGRPGIFAYRPAPLQVNFLGYPGTMGAPFYDYILADRYVIPLEHRAHYAEKIVTLPHAYQCNDDTRVLPAHTPTRAEAGLPETGFVFCCFNNNNKIAPETFDIWMRLLAQVPQSVLWLLEDSAVAARNLKREAEARGIAASRLVFAARAKPEDHLARHRLAGLFLDTLPYGAHTTASDALWMGLPVVTLMGTAFAGRVAASLLNAIGVPELVTHSPEAYEALALKLARDPSALAALKEKLAANRATHPLFDTARFARGLEAAYREMWTRHRSGRAPEHFTVTEPPP